jgi:hypothetical protein
VDEQRPGSCALNLTAGRALTSPYDQSVNPEGDPADPADILVVIGHPFGDVEVPLTVWIARGPGPRPLVRPTRARSRSTGQPLPLSVIPLRYRNDEEARQAIHDGLIDNPWPPPDAPDDTSPERRSTG